MRLLWMLPIGLLAIASCATLDGDEGSTTAGSGGAATGGATGGSTTGSSMTGSSTTASTTSGTSGTAGSGAGQAGSASTGVGAGGSAGASAATGAGGGSTGGTSAGGASTAGSGGTSSGGASGGAGANRDAGADRGATGGSALDASRGPDAAPDGADAARVDATDDRSSPEDASGDGSSGGNPEPGRLAGITAFHNQVRAAVGVGPLTWDPTIAATAAAYAANCRFVHSGTAGLGENLSAYAPPGGRAASAPVNDWASEQTSYDYANNTCAAGKVCGHYTQVVWRNTLRLGCAVQTCSVNSPFMGFPNWEIWVCNYAPPGNVGSQKPY